MIPMADSTGYREAMVGALSLYDSQGERQHTVYLAAAPEYGKAEFKPLMHRILLYSQQDAERRFEAVYSRHPSFPSNAPELGRLH